MQEEALVPSNDFAIRLPAFEGPLDLLLYLIRRNEVDIYDIPIERVTAQYIEILGAMEEMDLGVAGEFFVMASTLMYIKSRMLLPKKDQGANEDEPEEADPRWELVQQLLEYRKFKDASVDIENLIAEANDRIARIGPSRPAETADRPLQPVDRVDLWNTFNQVLRRLSERIREGEIHAEQITVADRMEFLMEHMRRHRSFRFSELFGTATTVNAIVATFLALLELARLRQLELSQETAFADIRCEALDPDAPDESSENRESD